MAGSTGDGLSVHAKALFLRNRIWQKRPLDQPCPRKEELFESLCLDQAKHPSKGIVTWDPVFKLEKFLEPFRALSAKFGDLHPAFSTTKKRTDTHHDHVEQTMLTSTLDSRIGKLV